MDTLELQNKWKVFLNVTANITWVKEIKWTEIRVYTLFVMEIIKPVQSTDLQISLIKETLFKSLIVTDSLQTACTSNFLLHMFAKLKCINIMGLEYNFTHRSDMI